MKTITRIKLLAATAFFIIFGSVCGQMNLGAEVPGNDDFLYLPNAADFQGTWRTTGNRDIRIVLSGVLNTNIEIGGLAAQDLEKIVGSAKKGFMIRRDAGTFFFEGCIQNSGKGSGRFYFRSDSGYADKMKNLQSPNSSLGSTISNSSIYYCAVHDLSYDFAKKIKDAGCNKISLNDLLALRSIGVTAEYIKAMFDLGYKDILPDDLILLTVQKVPTAFIKKVIGTSDNLPTIRELTLIWMFGDMVADFKSHKN
jgi:hypothetical protein